MPTWRASNGSTPTWHFAEPRRHAETRGSAVAKGRAWRPRGRAQRMSAWWPRGLLASDGERGGMRQLRGSAGDKGGLQ